MNVLRSTLSSTNPKIDGYAVVEQPYVLNLLKGILNNRPVNSVIHIQATSGRKQDIEKLDSKSVLSLKHFSLKLATLLAITWHKRVSSLSKLNMERKRRSSR